MALGRPTLVLTRPCSPAFRVLVLWTYHGLAQDGVHREDREVPVNTMGFRIFFKRFHWISLVRVPPNTWLFHAYCRVLVRGKVLTPAILCILVGQRLLPRCVVKTPDILMTNEVCLGNHEKGLAAGLFVDGLAPQRQGDGVKCEMFTFQYLFCFGFIWEASPHLVSVLT